MYITDKMSGQSITDRITAAQHSVTGSAVSKTVCKATTHEVMGPKKKHLDCKYEPGASHSFTRRAVCRGVCVSESVLWLWLGFLDEACYSLS